MHPSPNLYTCVPCTPPTRATPIHGSIRSNATHQPGPVQLPVCHYPLLVQLCTVFPGPVHAMYRHYAWICARGVLCPMPCPAPYALCPMPCALCGLPYALLPIIALQASIFLKQLVSFYRMPITRNQLMVMTTLVTDSMDLPTLVADLDSRTKPDLQWRIAALVDLVALCCVGHHKNSATEEPAQGLVPLQHVFRILGDTENVLQLELQFPFITFLREVWWPLDAELEPEDKVGPRLWWTGLRTVWG